MYIKEYLVQKGFREEWFDDTGTIARIDSNFLSDIFFKIFNSEHNKLFYFTPFNKEDRTGSRKLWLHNIVLPNLTKIKLDKELQYNSQFMSMFVVGYLIHYVVSTGLFISAYLRLVHVTGYEVIER